MYKANLVVLTYVPLFSHPFLTTPGKVPQLYSKRGEKWRLALAPRERFQGILSLFPIHIIVIIMIMKWKAMELQQSGTCT